MPVPDLCILKYAVTGYYKLSICIIEWFAVVFGINRTQASKTSQTISSGAVLLSGLWLLSWTTLSTTWNAHQPLLDTFCHLQNL